MSIYTADVQYMCGYLNDVSKCGYSVELHQTEIIS